MRNYILTSHESAMRLVYKLVTEVTRDLIGLIQASPQSRGMITQVIVNHIAKRLAVFKNWEGDD
jgi:hypothetical protein